MVTDRRPSRGRLRDEYDASTRLEEIPVPGSHGLTPLFDRLEAPRDAEALAPMSQVCEELLRGFAEFYDVPAPSMKLLGVRPHRTREGRLSYELLGDYNL